MKRLTIMRHAKSDWEAGVRDHERPLNARGTTAAQRMGRVLSEAAQVPDAAYSSTAVRARTTLQLALTAGGWGTNVEYLDALYESDVSTCLRIAAGAPDDIEHLMLVGHEPTWSALVGRLTGATVAMRTATVVGIDLYAAAWSELPDVQGEITFVLQARMFT